MRVRDRFLRELYRRTEGRSDRTVHALLHVAKPLRLSDWEARSAIIALLRDGLIGADPMFDRLIRLTEAGIAVCEQRTTMDSIMHEPTPDDIYAPLAALRSVYTDIRAPMGNQELIAH